MKKKLNLIILGAVLIVLAIIVIAFILAEHEDSLKEIEADLSRSGSPFIQQTCGANDWFCICSAIKTNATCQLSYECSWTNYHSSEYYCMQTFCSDYNQSTCAQHSRCTWVFDSSSNSTYCEERAYLADSKFVVLNSSIYNSTI